MPYDDEQWSDFGDETSVEFKIRQQKAADELKKLDKHYERYTIPYNKVGPDGKFHKKITIEQYGSKSTGSTIRNAVTGANYPIIAGSSDEDLVFKVVEASGRYGRKEPLFLYYDTPEQFENHHFATVSTDVKKQWFERNLEARIRLKIV
jgi:hypothetical protein